jgi:hypothetical protein
VIYSKAIDHKRDVKRGTISPDPSIEALLAAYQASVAPISQRRKK